MFPNNYKDANDVFASEGMPGSFVDRNEYIQDLKSALSRNNSLIIEVSGASRTGKTILVKRCIDGFDMRKIHMTGHMIKSVADFLSLVGKSLGLSNAQQDIIHATIGISGSEVGWERIIAYNREILDLITIIENKLRKIPTIITIDDFHWVPSMARNDIIKCMKSLMDLNFINSGRGIKFIVILIPTREIHSANIWNEMTIGRVVPIKLPLWDYDHLRSIAAAAFSQNDAYTIGLMNLARECYGLPSIMQEYCLKYCNIYENGRINAGQLIRIDPHRIQKVLEGVGEDQWHLSSKNHYHKLTSGDAVKTGWRLERRKDIRTGNLNQMILHAITLPELPSLDGLRITDNVEIPLVSIVSRLQRSVSASSFSSIEAGIVEEYLVHMSNYAENQYNNLISQKSEPLLDPIISYDTASQILTVYSPAFLVALRHATSHEKVYTQQSDIKL